MNKGQLQIIAEKVSSTIRVLELLRLDYEVSAPKNNRKDGNRSPRVVYVNVGKKAPLRVYNSAAGHTWANAPDGAPIPEVKSVEDLFIYLKEMQKGAE